MLLAHVSAPPPRLAQLCPEYASVPGVQRLLDRLLAKGPSARPRRASEVVALCDALARELGPLQSGPARHLPLRAARPGRAARAMAWAFSALCLGFAARYGSQALTRWQGPGLTSPLTAATGWRSLPNLTPVQPARDASVHSVTIASVPTGAVVKLSGAELGVTPYKLQLKRPLQLRVERADHEPRTIRVDPRGEPNVVVKLRPLPPLRVPDDVP